MVQNWTILKNGWSIIIEKSTGYAWRLANTPQNLELRTQHIDVLFWCETITSYVFFLFFPRVEVPYFKPSQTQLPFCSCIFSYSCLSFCPSVPHRIVLAVESFLKTIDVAEGSELQSISDNIGVAVVCPNTSTSLELSVVGMSSSASIRNATFLLKPASESQQAGSRTSFLLPAESLVRSASETKTTSSCKRRQAQFIVYANNNLFLDARYINSSTSNGTIASGRIISAGVGEEESLDLTQPANMTFISEIEVCDDASFCLQLSFTLFPFLNNRQSVLQSVKTSSQKVSVPCTFLLQKSFVVGRGTPNAAHEGNTWGVYIMIITHNFKQISF